MSSIESKVRRRTRWMLTILTAVNICLWLGSAFFSITRIDADEKYMTLGHGTLHVMWTDSPLELITTWRQETMEWVVETAPPLPILQNQAGPDGLSRAGRTGRGLTLRPDWQMSKGWWWFDVPLWIPALILAAPAAVLWRRRIVLVRRQARGQCLACGYPRATEVARCPECGVAPGG